MLAVTMVKQTDSKDNLSNQTHAYLQPAAYRQRISSRLDCNQGIMNIQLSELAVASRPALSVGDAFWAVNRLRDQHHPRLSIAQNL
jgi:hypothetical protein